MRQRSPWWPLRQPPALRHFFCNQLTTDYFRRIWQDQQCFRQPLFIQTCGWAPTSRPAIYRLRVPPVSAGPAWAAHHSLQAAAGAAAHMVMKRVEREYCIRRMMSNLHAGQAGARVVRELDDRRQDPRDERDARRAVCGAGGDRGAVLIVQNLGYLNCTSSAATICSRTPARRPAGNG